MSKQSENKEKQGFQKKSPCCGNCINFNSEMIPLPWNKEYSKETNMRCLIGGFKVGKSNWCKEHRFNEQ